MLDYMETKEKNNRSIIAHKHETETQERPSVSPQIKSNQRLPMNV